MQPGWGVDLARAEIQIKKGAVRLLSHIVVSVAQPRPAK